MSNILVNCRFLFDGHDLSGDGNTIDLSEAFPMQDATTFVNTGKVNRPGFPEGKFSYAGVTQYGTGAVEETLALHKGSLGVPILASPTGNAGDRGNFLLATLNDQEPIKGKAGELTMFAVDGVSASGTGGILDGTILEDGKTTRTGSFVGAFYLIGGATSSQQLFAICQLLSLNAGNVTVTIQNASDGVGTGLATAAAFPAQTAVGGLFLAPVAGPITNTYYRVSVAVAGGATSFALAIAVAVR